MILLILSCFTTSSCSKKISVTQTPCANAVEAKLTDLTGLDGCSWVLELENGKRLEPINLEQFSNIELVDGKKVLVEYQEQNSASVCMVGKTVKITCLTEP